jgi:hypothetical protein
MPDRGARMNQILGNHILPDAAKGGTKKISENAQSFNSKIAEYCFWEME